MSSCCSLGKPASLPTAKSWQRRFRTLRAMSLLCGARLTVAFVRFDRWRDSLGYEGNGSLASPQERADARQAAADVEWAAKRLPFATKCLPRAIALSWLLRGRSTAHSLVFAVRPADMRAAPDAIHAWVEVDGATILGDMPGPWLETLRLGERTVRGAATRFPNSVATSSEIKQESR